MLSPKQLLIKIISLLLIEEKSSVDTDSSALIDEVLDTIPRADSSLDEDWGKVVHNDLLLYAHTLVDAKKKGTFPDTTELLQQVRISCREETFLYDALKDGVEHLTSGSSDDVIVDYIRSARHALEGHLNDEKIRSLVSEYGRAIAFGGDKRPLREVAQEMGERLMPLVETSNTYSDPAEMGSIDFNNRDSLQKAFEQAKVEFSDEGKFITGWKLLNKMLGSAGGIRRGQMVLISALAHNFKSGFMMCLFIQLIRFNKPYLRDPSKKPTFVFLSLENELAPNLVNMYAYLKENETGEKVDEVNFDVAEATEYLANFFNETGYEVVMRRIDPSEWSYRRFIMFLEGLIADGHEIVALFVDYLNMVPKTGIPSGIAGNDIKLLFRYVRNFCSSRGISCFTPHQISSDAKTLLRQGTAPEEFVKEVAGKGYYEHCRTLDTEPDLEIYLHLVKRFNKTYLTVARGKHRDVKGTPLEDCYFIMPFEPICQLPLDYNKPDSMVFGQSALNDEGFDNDVDIAVSF